MIVKLYDRLKSLNIIETYKEFSDLIWIRAIWVNDHPVDDPKYEINEKDRIKVGIKFIDED